MFQDTPRTTINERATIRPSWHFPVSYAPDAEDAGNARDAATQLTGTDPIFAFNILRLSDTQR